MKTIKIIIGCALLCIGLISQSCSVDNDLNSDEVTTENLIVNTSEQLRGGKVEVPIVIEWGENTPEPRKVQIREDYMLMGILIKYEPCEDKKYENWYIYCDSGACSKQSDTPVDTDDDVQRLFPQKTCKEL